VETLIENRWLEFKARTHCQTLQGPVGRAPRLWLDSICPDLAALPEMADLPHTKQIRAQVRAICRDHRLPVLVGYVHAMAWGGQGAGPGIGHARAALDHREKLMAALEALRKGGMTPVERYDLFAVDSRVPGLGPSFFTKLLYFFSPDSRCYIMDQWTAKSVNFLFGREVIRLVSGTPAATNTGKDYAAFCDLIDQLAARDRLERKCECSGDRMEEKLFCRGGRRPGPWRAYLKSHWREPGTPTFRSTPHGHQKPRPGA